MSTSEPACPTTDVELALPGPSREAMLEIALEHLPLAVCLVCGTNLQVLHTNSRYLNIFPDAVPGQSMAAFWPENGEDFVARCRGVLATGSSHYIETKSLANKDARDSPSDATHYDVSLQRVPLPERSGWGLMISLREGNQGPIAARQFHHTADLDAYRLRLTDALRPLADPIAIQTTASRLLCERLNANRVAYFEVQGRDYVVARDFVRAVPPITGRFPIQSFGAKLLADFEAGRTVRVEDVSQNPDLSDAERAAYIAIQIRAHLGVPLIKRGRFVGGLAVHSATRRRWQPDEITIVEQTAERTWDAVERARAEAAMVASEARYRTLVESSREGIVTTNVEGYFEHANPAYQKMLGYTLAELKTLTYQQVTPQRWHEYEMSLVRDRILPLGDSGEYEKEYIRKDGTVFPVSLRCWCIRNSEGQPLAMQAIVRDITERKQAEEALRASMHREQQRAEELQTILDTAPVGLAIALDPEGLHIRGNEANEQLLGLKRGAELSAKQPQTVPYRPMLHGRELDVAELPMQRAVRGEKVAGQTLDVLCADGRTISVYAKATPLFDEHGRPRGAVGAFLDISALKQAENKLRAAHDTFRHLVDNSPFGIYVVDADFRLVQVSAGAQKVFANVRPLLNSDFAEVLRTIWPEPFATETINRFRHTLASGEPYHSPNSTERRRDTSDTESYDWKIERVTLPDGRNGVVCHFYDLSERQRYEAALREREERFRAVFEYAGTGIAITDLNGQFQHGNPAYCRLLGYTEEELRKHVFSDLVHPDDRAANLEANTRLHAGEVPYFELENRYIRKDGGIVWVHKVVSLLRSADGSIAQHVALITDITERRRMEDALRLEDRRKDEFLATLAHELRNPLAPLSSALQVMEVQASTDPVTVKLQGMMQRQVSQLTRLVNDLLEVSRITRGKIELKIERVDVREVVYQAIETSEPLITASRHQLQVQLPDEPVFVEADAIRLAQVFTNLLNNAAKYTQEGGTIGFRVEPQQAEIVVRVSDNGIGISADMLPRVFDIFMQAGESLHRARGGLGIGLTLVRHLLEMHGGRIEALSDGTDRGSEFVVHLPRSKTLLPKSPASIEVRAPQCVAQRVLVVDDNQDAADSLVLLLQDEATEVAVAYDGYSALCSLADFKPQVILLDLGMPGMSGLETAQRIRAHPDGHSVKIIAVTGWGQEADRKQTVNAGFNGHLVKPIDINALTALLATDDKPASGSH